MKLPFPPALAATVFFAACGPNDPPAVRPVVPLINAEQAAQLEISTTAASVISEQTGAITRNTALTQYMDRVAADIDAAVDAKLVRHGHGLVVAIPAYGIHTPTLSELRPLLQREAGLQIFVVGHSVFDRGSVQCSRVTTAARDAVSFLKRSGIFSTRVWSFAACDQIPPISFDNQDWEKEERVELVIYPSRSLVNSITKADGAKPQPKN
jgi:hypothetical protein